MLGFWETISVMKSKARFKKSSDFLASSIPIIFIFFIFGLFSFREANSEETKNIECEEKFLVQLWMDPYGLEHLDNQFRFCFAEALVRQIDYGYLKSVPRLKPKVSAWFQTELKSGDNYRIVEATQDEDYARYAFFNYFDNMRDALLAAQENILLEKPTDEVLNWLIYVESFSSDQFEKNVSKVQEAYFPLPKEGKIKPFSAIGPHWLHEKFILGMVINSFKSGQVVVNGKPLGH